MSVTRALGIVAAFAALVGWVWIAPFSLLGTVNLALTYGIVAISLVVLTGWVGQISLAQASFVGIGAFVTGVVVRNWGIPFPATLPIAAAAAAGSAALLGVVALRVRGLYLAVATLIFAWMAQEYLFNQPWLAGVGGASEAPARPLGTEGSFPYLDFTDRRTFYYVLLACLAASVLAVVNLRDSKTGRAWFAVKGSEVAAASLGIAVTRYKLLAFAVSGFIAGLAGNLVITHQQVVAGEAFAPNVSLFYLAIAVVGGLTRVGGAIAGGLLFASLEEIFYRVEALQGFLEIVSALLLAVVLLFFPAGLAGLPDRLRSVTSAAARPLGSLAHRVPLMSRRRGEQREDLAGEAAELDGDIDGESSPLLEEQGQPADVAEPAAGPERRLLARLGRRFVRPEAPSEVPDALAQAFEATAAESEAHARELEEQLSAPVSTLAYRAGTATKVDLPPREERAPVLAARDITVKFGGLTAVDNVSLEVRRGEIVGLIGPNGAGKTTLFNAISGLNEPTAGTVELFGEEVTALPVHERAQRGMGRTFQAIQLFPQLSVFDNLLVATHARNTTGFAGTLIASEGAVAAERVARERVAQVVRLLDLGEVAQRPVAGLPFGVLRLVEMARALVTGAPFVMLDEPASGLDNSETDRFADLLLWVRQSLGVTLLLIEHDVRMVTSLTDHMYVVDRGKLIASGTPADVQRDPVVIAAYLGQAGDSADADSAVDVEPEAVTV